MAAVSTTPSVLDWTAYAGDANAVILEFTADGVAMDTTGAVLTAQARLTPQDAAVALTATITEVNTTTGSYIVGWDGEAIRTLLAGAQRWEGFWDLQLVLNGVTTSPLAGKFVALHDVTRL